MKQLDLNVRKPEHQRLPKLYAADSINLANLRIHFEDEDAGKVMQMLSDHKISQAIWNLEPVSSTVLSLSKSVFHDLLSKLEEEVNLPNLGQPHLTFWLD